MKVTHTASEQIYKKHNLLYNNSNFSTKALYRRLPGLGPQHNGCVSGAAAALVRAPFADAAPGTLGTARGAARTAAWKGQEMDRSVWVSTLPSYHVLSHHLEKAGRAEQATGFNPH